ncbi:hypothetical protein PHLCEN_2v4272 [Hermanssonia centrifuga]|uniref:Cytochrome P450 n=1 Tax=Hermanssonia centrifuga TaxID=98765 RepID=A0A2R6PVH8_9APHY|nr:hypothetical protein PHLCEN_2v4272 [Hermanssonia centrifuga]
MDIPTIFYTYPSWMVIGFAVIVSGLLFAKQDKSKQAPLPPGPKAWPIVGNTFQLPKEYEWLTYQEWSRKYGSDILYFTSWGQPHIVINSAQVASELLEKKSSLYSDRPRMPMLNELVGFDWDFSFMPYGNEWKESRKIFTQYFRPTAAANYRPIETQKTRDLLLELLETPDDFMKLFRTLSGKIIMALVYGIEVQKTNDPYVGIAERGLQGANMAGNVGTYLVDFIPALKYVPDWFPGARFKRQAREWRVDVDGMITVPYNAVKSAMENGRAVPSMLHSILEESGENADALRSKLTASVPAVAYNAMLLNPEIQRKAQQQLDKVVGPHRLPDFSDQSSLPYISAICKEVYLWFILCRVMEFNLIFIGAEMAACSSSRFDLWPLVYPLVI